MTVSGEGRQGLILPDDPATVPAVTPWNGMTERTVDRRFASFTQALLAGALAALACLAPVAAQSPAPDLPSTLTETERPTIALFERVSPSVVGVTVIIGADDPAKFRIDIGSGFIWDGGNIVTNEHVVHDAGTITIWLASGEQFEAEVAGVAPNFDLAVLRAKEKRPLPPPVDVTSSANLKVGQSAYAIGSPWGLDHSMTAGIVSGLRRELPTTRGHEVTNMIQTDAAVYPGNSGGPLLDSAGRLIGVVTISYHLDAPNTALGFAIPSDTVSRVVPELIAKGRIPTAGIGIVPVDDPTRAGADGLMIAKVRPGSPAERAGLRGAEGQTKGDVIVAANGIPIRTPFDLTNLFERVGIGKSIALTVKRDGRAMTMPVDIADIDQPSRR
jgi:2-alkenal reductase